MATTPINDDSLPPFGNGLAPTGTPRILACLDRSELSKTILTYAVMLSRAISGSLTLMHVLESSSVNNPCSHDVLVWELKRHEAHQYLEQMLEHISGRNVPAEIEIEEGNAAEQILGYLRNNPVDFVTLASHGTHGLAEWSLSSTAAKIIGCTHCSFIIVPSTPDYQHAGLEPRIERILVPLDDSLSSQTALPIATRIARQEHAELVLLHAIEPMSFDAHPAITHADREVIQASTTILESVAKDHFEQLASRIRNEGLSVSVVIKPSANPIQLISETISTMGIDFLVMSAHGSARSEDYPLARTSAHMTAHTPVPLLIVQDLDKTQICKALKKRRYDRAPSRYSKSGENDIS